MAQPKDKMLLWAWPRFISAPDLQATFCRTRQLSLRPVAPPPRASDRPCVLCRLAQATWASLPGEGVHGKDKDGSRATWNEEGERPVADPDNERVRRIDCQRRAGRQSLCLLCGPYPPTTTWVAKVVCSLPQLCCHRLSMVFFLLAECQ